MKQTVEYTLALLLVHNPYLEADMNINTLQARVLFELVFKGIESDGSKVPCLP